MGSSQSTPIQAQQQQKQQEDTGKISQCPIHQISSSSSNNNSNNEEINESNNIPQLAQTPAPGQKTKLSLERTLSSIPRPSSQDGDSSNISSCPAHQNDQRPANKKETWVYPSPQQFYNALVRKGWETPEESVPIMVDIHNWMNEAVWNEVLRWESRYFFNPNHSSSSSTHSIQPPQSNQTATLSLAQPEITLVKFQGRPNELSPKARFNILLSMIFPNLYNPIRPFDRHDWSISREHLRKNDDDHLEKSKLCRYVIDYYNGGTDEDGNPVFHFDVRPAIDDIDSLVVRLKEWARIKNETWFCCTMNPKSS